MYPILYDLFFISAVLFGSVTFYLICISKFVDRRNNERRIYYNKLQMGSTSKTYWKLALKLLKIRKKLFVSRRKFSVESSYPLLRFVPECVIV